MPLVNSSFPNLGRYGFRLLGHISTRINRDEGYHFRATASRRLGTFSFQQPSILGFRYYDYLFLPKSSLEGVRDYLFFKWNSGLAICSLGRVSHWVELCGLWFSCFRFLDWSVPKEYQKHRFSFTRNYFLQRDDFRHITHHRSFTKKY